MAPAVGERTLPPHSTWQQKQRTMANATAGDAMARADNGRYDRGAMTGTGGGREAGIVASSLW
jgi:hypothetical protein